MKSNISDSVHWNLMLTFILIEKQRIKLRERKKVVKPIIYQILYHLINDSPRNRFDCSQFVEKLCECNQFTWIEGCCVFLFSNENAENCGRTGSLLFALIYFWRFSMEFCMMEFAIFF